MPPMPPSPVAITIWLSQSTPIAGYPLSGLPTVQMLIAGNDGEELCAVPLYMEMAHALGRSLLAMSPDERLVPSAAVTLSRS